MQEHTKDFDLWTMSGSRLLTRNSYVHTYTYLCLLTCVHIATTYT